MKLRFPSTILFILTAVALLASCGDMASIRQDYPIKSVREYERMIVGRLDADYIGNAACLEKCHNYGHDRLYKDFQQSVHASQVDVDSGLPLVNCESCHGPGSLAVEGVTDNGDPCNYKTLLDLNSLPSVAQSLICLKCHSAASTPTLQFWNSSTHATSEVSCIDCHALHKGPQQKVDRDEVAELCYGCHLDKKMEFANFSHHPVPEGKMACVDCHNPHGTANDKDLLGVTVKATCTKCHMEYQGPFVYEHADVTETCTNCHKPHGSPNEPLLEVAQPFLCLQCHSGHHGARSDEATLSNRDMKSVFFNRCTDCHSMIHGTDIPNTHGRGSFISR